MPASLNSFGRMTMPARDGFDCPLSEENIQGRLYLLLTWPSPLLLEQTLPYQVRGGEHQKHIDEQTEPIFRQVAAEALANEHSGKSRD